MRASLALLVTTAPLAAWAQEPVAVQRGVTVRPDTVTVGDPFNVLVRIRAPAGAVVTFPEEPDSAAAVEALDPRLVRPVAGTEAANGIDVTAVYRLAAWDVGRQPLLLGDVVVRLRSVERRIPLGELTVFVRSVLPADSSERVPKPARALFVFGWPWWYYALAAMLALALLGLLVWWWIRRRRRRGAAERVDPYQHARREFDRVEALGLLAAGERGRYVALMVEVVREYLARRFATAPPSLTTSEIIAALRGAAGVPVERLSTLLGEADLIKFARRPVSGERARALGQQARRLVRDIEEAQQALPAAAPAEAA